MNGDLCRTTKVKRQQFFIDNLSPHTPSVTLSICDSLLCYRKPNQLNRFFTQPTLHRLATDEGGSTRRSVKKSLQSFLWLCDGSHKKTTNSEKDIKSQYEVNRKVLFSATFGKTNRGLLDEIATK